MEAVFLKILNMSINAGWIILAVILLRLVLKRAPKWINCLLWGLVGLRLVLPFSIESALSLLPNSEVIPENIVYQKTPAIDSGVPEINEIINPIISSLAPEMGASVNPMQIVVFIASLVWIVGVALMLLYSLITYIRIRIKVREAVLSEKGVYFCDNIASPFILGLIKPRIYLNSDIPKEDIEYCLAHEKAHLKRRDHLIKPFGFLLLSVYWFNPLMWVSYILLCRDIELATDEKVIKKLGDCAKKPYSEALVNCSVKRRMIAACPVAFGEVSVKGRIKSVLSFKKPTVWIIIAALVVSFATAVFFLTDPEDEDKTDTSSVAEGSKPTKVITEKELREKYPEYYNLSAENGLKIYAWQMGVKNYSCVLVEGDIIVFGTDLINYQNPATIEEMKVILSQFDGSDEDVRVIATSHPASSYYYSINSDYLKALSEKFGGLKVYSSEYAYETDKEEEKASSTNSELNPSPETVQTKVKKLTSSEIIQPDLSRYITTIPVSSTSYSPTSLYSKSTRPVTPQLPVVIFELDPRYYDAWGNPIK